MGLKYLPNYLHLSYIWAKCIQVFRIQTIAWLCMSHLVSMCLISLASFNQCTCILQMSHVKHLSDPILLIGSGSVMAHNKTYIIGQHDPLYTLDIQLKFLVRRCLNPQTSPEKAFKGSNSCPPGIWNINQPTRGPCFSWLSDASKNPNKYLHDDLCRVETKFLFKAMLVNLSSRWWETVFIFFCTNSKHVKQKLTRTEQNPPKKHIGTQLQRGFNSGKPVL